jgi:predicted Zn-dependent protease
VAPPPAAPPPVRSSPTPAASHEPSPTLDARLTPERILATAEGFFENEKYWEAIQQLEPMVLRAEEPTRARAKMLLARAYMKNPKWRKQAEGVLQSLLDESPRDIAVCLVLAQLYRDVNLPARAKALYRKVLDIQAGHAAAVSALAAFDQEAQAPAAKSRLGGLFKVR